MLEETQNNKNEVCLPWKQADFYEALAEAQSDLGEGVFIVEGHSRRIIYANEALCKIFGYTKDEIMNLKSVFDLVPPENVSELEVRGALRMARATVADHYESVGLRKDGSRVFTEISVKAIEGSETHSVALVRDISDRKKKEEVVAEAHRIIDDLYNSAPCGYHSVDKTGTYVYVNDTLLRWLGYTRAEVIGKVTIFDLVPPECQEPVREFFNKFVKTCKDDELETELIRKDGGRIPVLVKACAVIDAQGNFVMSRTMMIDMTEQKRARGELQSFKESQKRLAAAVKEMQSVLEGFAQ